MHSPTNLTPQILEQTPIPSRDSYGAVATSYAPTPLLPLSQLCIIRKAMSDNSPQLLPGTLYMLILRMLAGGPMHGYAIARRIKECSQDVLDVEEGSLYPALNRMLIKGWVQAKWGVSESNRKARFYRLTNEGRKALESEAGEFNKLVTAIQLVMKKA